MVCCVRTVFAAGILGTGLLCGCRTPAPTVEPSYLPDGRLRPVIVSRHRERISLDGDLADWRGIPFVEVTPATGVFDLESSTTDDPADIRYRFAVCNDDDALYVAVEVHDDQVRLDDTAAGETHAKAWWDDAVEVFIDGNRNRAPHARVKSGEEYAYGGEFSLVANGAATSNCTAWPDTFGKPEFWQGGTSVVRHPDGSGVLRYEYRLTWNVMGGNVRPGDAIGFTIGIQDDDDGGERDHALYWIGFTPHCWKDENGWGDVLLTP
jgi:hypothetical protein